VIVLLGLVFARSWAPASAGRVLLGFGIGGQAEVGSALLAANITWTVPGENRIAGTYGGLEEALDYFGRRRDLA
jgi:ketosteroid isomerase-like protein